MLDVMRYEAPTQAQVRLTNSRGEVSYIAFETISLARLFVYHLPALQKSGYYTDVWKAIVIPLMASTN